MTSYLEFVGEYNVAMAEGRQEEIDILLRNSFADWSVIIVSSVEKVMNAPHLNDQEKELFVSLLASGQTQVWVLTDVVPWEH